MSGRHRIYSVLIALAILLGLGFAASSSPVSAAGSTSSMTIHARECPDGALTNLFTDCHGNAVPGQTWTFGTRVPKTTDGQGNVDFGKIPAGTYTFWLVDGEQPGGDFKLRVFCSNQHSKAVEVKVKVTGGEANFNWTIKRGFSYVCDAYWIPL